MQTIGEFVKGNEQLTAVLEFAKNARLADFVESSDIWKYDAVAYDDDTDEICKVIYLDEDKKQTWAISDILSYAKVEDVPEDRREVWEKYMSQYEWQDPAYYNAKNLIEKLKDNM